jgi:hypothetical protein
VNSERGHECNAQNYFALACSYLTQRSSFFTGGDEWRSQSEWRNRYGYQHCVIWHSLFILIILHVLCIQKEAINTMLTIILLLQVHIWHRGPRLSMVSTTNGVRVTEEWQVFGTSSVSNGIAGIYWSYCMSCILKETVAFDHTHLKVRRSHKYVVQLLAGFKLSRLCASEAAITNLGHILRCPILRIFFIFYQVCIHR